MMRQGTALGNEYIALLPADMAIEQSVPMNVTRFLPVMKKADPAESMDSHLHPRPAADCRFNRAHRA
jgi:hypothetical protein